nr:CCR4-NOT transcription complex subunit 9-like [Coffea arabica]
MDNFLGSSLEKTKGISPRSGSSSSNYPSVAGNTQSPAYLSSSDAFFIPLELSSMTMERLIPILDEFNLCEKTLLHLKDASSSKSVACSRMSHNVDVKKVWDSPGTAFKLLEVLISVYKKLDPLQITNHEFGRICGVLALFQMMASHPEVKMGLIRANIPYYLYPFLQAKADDKALAQIRLSSLAVLCAFVMCEDPVQAQSVVHFLLESEAFPLCLSWMDKGTGRTQELATLIVAKILMQEKGLHYCSSRADRLFVTLQVLTGMVDQLARSPSASMLHKVVYCLVRLSAAARSDE